MARYHDLYFFLYPPPDIAALAAQYRCNAGLPPLHRKSAPMPAERLHITLQRLGRFEGCIPQDVLGLALAAGSAVDCAPFDVAFDLLHSRSGIANGTGTLELAGRGPAVKALRGFQRSLSNTMVSLGFPVDAMRSSFAPHLTLDYAHPPVARQTVAPVAWTVKALCLADSHYGAGRHEVLARWPLTTRQQAFSDW